MSSPSNEGLPSQPAKGSKELNPLNQQAILRLQNECYCLSLALKKLTITGRERQTLDEKLTSVKEELVSLMLQEKEVFVSTGNASSPGDSVSSVSSASSYSSASSDESSDYLSETSSISSQGSSDDDTTSNSSAASGPCRDGQDDHGASNISSRGTDHTDASQNPEVLRLKNECYCLSLSLKQLTVNARERQSLDERLTNAKTELASLLGKMGKSGDLPSNASASDQSNRSKRGSMCSEGAKSKPNQPNDSNDLLGGELGGSSQKIQDRPSHVVEDTLLESPLVGSLPMSVDADRRQHTDDSDSVASDESSDSSDSTSVATPLTSDALSSDNSDTSTTSQASQDDHGGYGHLPSTHSSNASNNPEILRLKNECYCLSLSLKQLTMNARERQHLDERLTNAKNELVSLLGDPSSITSSNASNGRRSECHKKSKRGSICTESTLDSSTEDLLGSSQSNLSILGAAKAEATDLYTVYERKNDLSKMSNYEKLISTPRTTNDASSLDSYDEESNVPHSLAIVSKVTTKDSEVSDTSYSHDSSYSEDQNYLLRSYLGSSQSKRTSNKSAGTRSSKCLLWSTFATIVLVAFIFFASFANRKIQVNSETQQTHYETLMTTSGMGHKTETIKSFGIIFDVDIGSRIDLKGIDMYLDTASSTHYEVWTKPSSWFSDNADNSDLLSGFRLISHGQIEGRGKCNDSYHICELAQIPLRNFEQVPSFDKGMHSFWITLVSDNLVLKKYKQDQADQEVVEASRHEMEEQLLASDNVLKVYYGAAVLAYPLEVADGSDLRDSAGFLGRLLYEEVPKD